MSAVELGFTRSGRGGDGVPLLLGGSLGTHRAMWEPQLSALADRVELIAFDQRGHGQSPVPDGPYSMAELGGDVLALMDRLGLERASYCGLSIGGMIGQWLAVNAPERIERLILLCTLPHMPPPANWHERAASVRAAGSPGAVADAVVGRWFTEGFAAAQPDVVARYRAMVAGTPAEGYAGCCEAIADLDLRDGLASITAPTLVIGGAQDPSISPEQERGVAEAVPGARFELLDPAAHLASVERAEAVSALIAEHLGVTA